MIELMVPGGTGLLPLSGITAILPSLCRFMMM